MAFFINLYFSKLLDVSIEKREIDGVEQDCIVFPLEKNGFFATKRGTIRLSLAMLEKRPNMFRQSHTLSIILNNEKRARYRELGLLPRFTYFGWARQRYFFSRTGYAAPHDSKSVEEILDE